MTGSCTIDKTSKNWVCTCQEGWTTDTCNTKTCKNNTRCGKNGTFFLKL